MKFRLLFAVVTLFTAIITSLSSCMTTKTSIGAYETTKGEESTYSRGKQAWFLWGIVPLGRTNVETPPDGNCKLTTRRNVEDIFISIITLGLVQLYSIKIETKTLPPIKTNPPKKEKTL